MNNKRLCLLLLLFLVFQFSFYPLLYAKQSIKVGVYENYPLVFFEKTGSVQGFFVDLLENIARRKQWDIFYQKDTYSNLLKKLDKNEIDLIIAVPGTKDLRMKYQYSGNPVFTNWGVLYTQKIQKINSVQDIQGKIVGVLQDDVYQEEFVKMLEKFSISCQFKYFVDCDKMLKELDKKKIDLAVVNRLYGLSQEKDLSIKQTDIIFSPMEMYFIANKNKNAELLNTIDEQLEVWKLNPRSFFYQRLGYWTSIKHTFQLPTWIGFSFLFLFILLSVLLIFIINYRRRIAFQRKSLQVKTNQLNCIQTIANLCYNQEKLQPELIQKAVDTLFEGLSDPTHLSLQLNIEKYSFTAGDINNQYVNKTDIPIKWGIKTYGEILIKSKKNISSLDKPYLIEFSQILAMYLQQKTVQLDLEQEQKQFRDVFFNASDGLFLFQRQTDGSAGQLISINHSALNWLGYSMDEVYTLRYGDIFVSPFHFRPDTQQSSFFESRMISKKGHIYNSEITVLLTEQKNQVYYLLIVRNVTEFRRWRSKLEKTNQAILQLQTNFSKNIQLLVNLMYDFCQKSEIMLLIEEEGASTLSSIVPEVYSDSTFEWAKWAKRISPASVSIEGEWMNYQDSTMIWVYPIRSQEQVFGILCINAADHQSIINKNKEFLLMITKAISNELVRKWCEQNLKNFIAMASHELRHPITVIKGFSETLQRSFQKLSEKEIKEILDTMTQNANRMMKQIVELLTVSRIEQNKFLIEKKDLFLPDFLHSVLREMRIKDTQHQYTLHIDSELDHKISLDPDKVHELLVILLDNARQHSPDNTEIEVSASIQHRFLHVSVSDRGEGITQEEAARIFDRFVQSKKQSNRKDQSLGLGLYIAKKIISAYQGTIYAEPRENGGAVFTFCIPLD